MFYVQQFASCFLFLLMALFLSILLFLHSAILLVCLRAGVLLFTDLALLGSRFRTALIAVVSRISGKADLSFLSLFCLVRCLFFLLATFFFYSIIAFMVHFDCNIIIFAITIIMNIVVAVSFIIIVPVAFHLPKSFQPFPVLLFAITIVDIFEGILSDSHQNRIIFVRMVVIMIIFIIAVIFITALYFCRKSTTAEQIFILPTIVDGSRVW
mmetsp:Transcript_11636/g.18647  ORF Transcript_11636/g.18647 Transcript_11636/m.18647 type:complete len:211 (-) Transcript_11636:286-918(-)